MTVNYLDILTLEKEGFLIILTDKIDHGQSALIYHRLLPCFWRANGYFNKIN
jgi:hypothetical protein